MYVFQHELPAFQDGQDGIHIPLDGLGEEADTSSSETSADGTMLTVTEGCNVRAEANSDSEIIGGLDEGDQVQKMGQEGDWIQIEYDGQTGYVYSGLLQ